MKSTNAIIKISPPNDDIYFCFFGKSFFYIPIAAAICTAFIAMIAVSPNRIDRPNPITTPRPKSFSQNRYAIDAFITLFDIAAMRIVDAAIMSAILPSLALDAISCVIASTSARPEIAPSA